MSTSRHRILRLSGVVLTVLGLASIAWWYFSGGGPEAILQGHDGPVYLIAFSPNGKTLASGADRVVRLWDLANDRQRAAQTGHTGFIESAAFSPDGRMLATASYDGTIMLWDPARILGR